MRLAHQIQKPISKLWIMTFRDFFNWSDCFWQMRLCKYLGKFGFIVFKLVVGDVFCKLEVSWNYNVAFFRNFLATLWRAFRSRSSCDNEKCPSLWIRRKWLKFLSLNKTIVHLAYYNLIQTIYCGNSSFGLSDFVIYLSQAFLVLNLIIVLAVDILKYFRCHTRLIFEENKREEKRNEKYSF